MKIKKILWATDGSKESDSALRYATFLAEKLGAEIVCLFVSEISFPITNLYPIPEDIIIEIAEKTENDQRRRAKELLKMMGIANKEISKPNDLSGGEQVQKTF